MAKRSEEQAGLAVSSWPSRLYAIAILIVLCLASCRASPATPGPSGEPWRLRSIPQTGGVAYGGLAWASRDLAAARQGGAAVGTANDGFELVLVDVTSGTVQVFSESGEDDSCGRIDEYSPLTSPDARLVWIWRCFGRGPERWYRVQSVIPPDKAVVTLADFRLGPTLHSLAVGVGANPRILAAIGSHICETIVEVGATGIEPWNVKVEGRGGSFDLNDPAVVDECRDVGWAYSPTISGSGSIAFLASTEAIGADGPLRLQRPVDIYVMDDFDSPAIRHDVSIENGGGLRWSPVAGELVFNGRVSGTEGTWLYDPATKRLEQISTVPVLSPSWSIDGEAIAGARRLGEPGSSTYELVLLEQPADQ